MKSWSLFCELNFFIFMRKTTRMLCATYILWGIYMETSIRIQDNWKIFCFVHLQIGANAGIVGMTKEHLGLALALNVPVFVVVTKIDMCPPNVMEETLKMLNRMLRSQGCRKVPIMIKTTDDVVVGAKNMLCER